MTLAIQGEQKSPLFQGSRPWKDEIRRTFDSAGVQVVNKENGDSADLHVEVSLALVIEYHGFYSQTLFALILPLMFILPWGSTDAYIMTTTFHDATGIEIRRIEKVESLRNQVNLLLLVAAPFVQRSLTEVTRDLSISTLNEARERGLL